MEQCSGIETLRANDDGKREEDAEKREELA
jgi:hypothetical protein